MSSPGGMGATLKSPELLSDVFSADTVIAPLAASGKQEVLEEMVAALAGTSRLTKARAKTVLAKLKEREAVGTTGIGRGFAVPHIRYDGVDRFMGVFGYAPDGVEFDSLDGNPAKAIFLVISPGGLKQEHLLLMSRLTRLMNHGDLLPFLKSCKKPDDYIALLDELEQDA